MTDHIIVPHPIEAGYTLILPGIHSSCLGQLLLLSIRVLRPYRYCTHALIRVYARSIDHEISFWFTHAVSLLEGKTSLGGEQRHPYSHRPIGAWCSKPSCPARAAQALGGRVLCGGASSRARLCSVRRLFPGKASRCLCLDEVRRLFPGKAS